MQAMNYYDILVYSVYSDLRTEVSRRFFGFLWWILEPLMYMATFYLVFGVALGQGDDQFASFLLAGMVIWKWFDGSVRLASTSICNAYGLSQQIHLPKVIYVLIPLLSNTFKFVIIFLLLIGFLIGSESLRTEALWALIPVLLCQFYFTFCLSVFFASLLPFFQDLRQVIDNFMLMLMFMSGVFYRASCLHSFIIIQLSFWWMRSATFFCMVVSLIGGLCSTCCWPVFRWAPWVF